MSKDKLKERINNDVKRMEEILKEKGLVDDKGDVQIDKRGITKENRSYLQLQILSTVMDAKKKVPRDIEQMFSDEYIDELVKDFNDNNGD